MRRMMATLLPALAFVLGGCGQEDDVEEIFTSGEWKLVNYYTGVDWGDYNAAARPIYTKPEDLKVINTFTITFAPDGTVTGNIENSSYTGRWQANAADRTVSLTRIQTSVTPTARNKEFIDRLKAARFYQGDSRMLRIAPAERTTCMQFRH